MPLTPDNTTSSTYEQGSWRPSRIALKKMPYKDLLQYTFIRGFL